jgi:DNA-directed RNA polymerase specialized sigma24 family protein
VCCFRESRVAPPKPSKSSAPSTGYPVYAFVRRKGYDAEGARDLTQKFFARLIEKNYLASADHDRGRFRGFLLMAAQRFLLNQSRDASDVDGEIRYLMEVLARTQRPP